MIISIKSALLGALPYLGHRLRTRISGWWQTLIFPALSVTYSFINPLQENGTWGSIAYTQVDNLPLMQLASITGVYGISFLIFWTSSMIVWAYEQKFQWQKIKVAVSLYGAIFLSTLLFGLFKTNSYFHDSPPAVRVAALTGNNLPVFESMYQDAFGKKLPVDYKTLTQQSPELQELQKAVPLFVKDPMAPMFKNTRMFMRSFQDSLLVVAGKEAMAGAKIIGFSEALFFTIKSEEADFIEKGKLFSRQHHAYLLLTEASILPGEIQLGTPYFENKAILINPKGEVLNTFLKNHPVPVVEGCVPGDGDVPVVKTEFGNIAVSICYDADFPASIRQAGEKNADMLLLPSGDWNEINPYHAKMAAVRAIENGFSLLRPVSHSLTIATDQNGLIINSNRYTEERENVMIASLPVRHRQTIYTLIGDSFAWLCVLSSALIITFSTYRAVEFRRSNLRSNQMTTGEVARV